MSEVDLSTLSKSELKRLIQRSRRQLSRVNKSEKPEIKSSDERVKAIADRVRELSRDLGMKRRDVLAAVAGNMRVALGSSSPEVRTDGEAAGPAESSASEPSSKVPSKPSKAAKAKASKATKSKTPASRRTAKKATTTGKRTATKRARQTSSASKTK